jgi:hypothetical protein
MLNKSYDTMKLQEQKRMYPRSYIVPERVDGPSLSIEYTHGLIGIELSELINIPPVSCWIIHYSSAE